MNIFLISHGFQVHYTLGFVNGLAENDISAFLVRSANVPQEKLSNRIQSADFGQNLGNESSRFAKAFNFIRYHLSLFMATLRPRTQIIHVIGILQKELLTGIVEGAWFRIFGRRYILTVHNLLPHEHRTRSKKAIFKWVYRIPHLLVVHTERMRKELIEDYGVDSKRILIIEHGINDAVPDTGLTFEAARQELRAKGVGNEPILLLFFGRIMPYKGVEDLLQSFAMLDERYHLLIAGRSESEEYGRTITKAIDMCPNRDRITYDYNWIDDQKIELYFKAADFLMLPYKHIDQSGLLFLSFRFGLPIIATDVGSIKRYLVNGAGAVVDPGSPQLFAEKINEMASRMEEMNRAAIAEYGTSFEWKSNLKPLISYYKSCDV